MDFHLERGLRLHIEADNNSLYSWAINEIDAQGQLIGRDQIPWVWTLRFTATSCVLCDSIGIKSPILTEEMTPAPEIERRQFIRVGLRSGSAGDDGVYVRETKFSMFGTDRIVSHGVV